MTRPERADHVVRGRVVTPDAVIADGAVVVAAGALAWVGPAGAAAAAGFGDAVAATSASQELVLPGLVDLHCHGGGGASFPDAATTAEAAAAVAEHRRSGTTTLVASLVTASPARLRAQVAVLAGLADAGDLAGVHCEGPFLAAARCGAQDPALLRAPYPALVEELAAAARGHLVSMTLAPELAGALGPGGVLAALVTAGATPSWGHTDAGPDDARAAVEQAGALLAAAPGARSVLPTVTHLFNGMPPWHHRAPGPVGEFLAAAARGRAVVELVADGVHLHPAVVRQVYETVGREGAVLVTDAMAAAGAPDGRYRLGSQQVVVAAGVARLAGSGALAGGTAHLLDVVRTTVAGGVPLLDAVWMASTGPARVLGDPRVGALAAGRRADLVVTDPDLRVRRVMRCGAWVPAGAGA